MSLWLGILGGQITASPPAGFTLGSNGKYYKLFSSQIYTRVNAASTASANGGWLFVPTSNADQNAAEAGFSYRSINLWVGMKFNEFGTFISTISSPGHPLDGTTLSYQDWQVGFPNGNGTNVVGTAGGWRDQASATTAYGFIAEWYD